MKIKSEKFSCKKGNMTIRGIVTMPAEGDRFPIALTCHGFMGNKSGCTQYADLLARNGYAVFNFDFCGGGIISSSDGKTGEMTVLTEVQDAKTVLEYAKSLEYTDEECILLLGCSQGGFVCGLTAAEMGDEIGQLIMLYPALSIPDDARQGSMLAMHFDPENIPETLHFLTAKIGRKYVTDVMGMDAFAEISKYHGRVLIIHGDRDDLVDISNSVKAEKAYREAGTDVTFVTIPGGDHGFSHKKYDMEAMDKIAEFIGGSNEQE